jgi:hypothetical protein
MTCLARRTIAFAVLLIGAPVWGCASHANRDGKKDEPIPECTAYVAAYQACMATLAPENIAQARADQARAGIATQLASARDDKARGALRKQCASNRSSLQATCHPGFKGEAQ